jgi:hypothetical protein
MVKALGGQRESEGVGVPLIGVSDASGGKGHHPLPEGCVTMPRRSSVSRVRENRTHGLKGVWGNRSALQTPRP